MRLFFLSVALFELRQAVAFVPSALVDGHRFALKSSTMTDPVPPTSSTEVESSSSSSAKSALLQVAQRLKTDYGIFLVDTKAKQDLKTAVEALEKQVVPPSSWTDELWGDWELVCTTASNADGLDTSKLPFFDAGPLKQIRDAITKTTNTYLTVTQRIRSSDSEDEASTAMGGGESLSRIDHVLEYRPPSVLRDVLDSLPEQLTDVNINPLQVSRSKLVLVHKASVTATTGMEDDPLKIQLSLKAIVLNVAGTSTFLDPTGQDVSSLNLPLGEFLNAGSFTTTYVDGDLRISRGPQGLVDQLRVFVRSGRATASAATAGVGVTPTLDVDETMDPEFGDIQSPSDVED